MSFPKRDETKPAEEQGIFHKFEVRRTDGSDQPGGKHHGCRYFVLDMDCDPHARAALKAYAESCRESHPRLSAELLLWAYEAPNAAPQPEQGGQRVPKEAVGYAAIGDDGNVKGLWVLRDWDHAEAFADSCGCSLAPVFFGPQGNALAAAPQPDTQEGEGDE